MKWNLEWNEWNWLMSDFDEILNVRLDCLIIRFEILKDEIFRSELKNESSDDGDFDCTRFNQVKSIRWWFRKGNLKSIQNEIKWPSDMDDFHEIITLSVFIKNVPKRLEYKCSIIVTNRFSLNSNDQGNCCMICQTASKNCKKMGDLSASL